jgi:hypothetical protein
MKFVKGEIEEKNTGFGEVIDADIKYMLQAMNHLTRREFNEEVFEEGTDVVVLIYTSAVEDEA